MTEVKAYHAWPTNAHLIEDVAKLGYIHGRVLDCTYGEGTFWKRWRPEVLVTSDLKPTGDIVADFTRLPFEDGAFNTVVFDPPYKLNGTPSAPDERYGVHEPTSWRDRLHLMVDGIDECIRVLGSGCLLVKCQDQVCSGEVRWQTDIITETATERNRTRKIDRFDMLGGRSQPSGRRQMHARRNASTLLVFAR